jgi:hypothetical protein
LALGYHGRERYVALTLPPHHNEAHRIGPETINTGTANPSQDHYTGSGSYHGAIAAQGNATAQTGQAMRGFMESRKFQLLRQPGSGAGDVRKARGYKP